MAGFDTALQQIVNVNISLATAGISKTGFGTMGCLTAHLHSTDRVTTFASTAAMATAGWQEYEAAYNAAVTHFSPLTDKPDSIKILRRHVKMAAVGLTAAVVVGTDYTLTIDDVDFTYEAQEGDAENDVLEALETAVNEAAGDIAAYFAADHPLVLVNSTDDDWTLAFSPEAQVSTSCYVLLVDVTGGSGSAEDGDYTVTLNGTDYTYTASSKTADEVAAELVALINADTANHLEAVATGSLGRFFIIGSYEYCGFGWALTDNMTGLYSLDETLAVSLDACKDEDNDWYGLMVTTRVQDEQEAAATWQELQTIGIYGTSDDNTNAETVPVNRDTSSLGAVLKALSRFRTWGIYCREADGGPDDPWAESAWFAATLTTDLDVETIDWKFRTLANVTTDKFTLDQLTKLLGSYSYFNDGKNYNIYQTVGGVDITREGRVFAGEFIDTIIGRDWLMVRITEAVYAVLTAGKKTPFTDGGILAVKAAVGSILNQGLGTQFLQFNADLDAVQGYYLFAPAALDTDATDRANRVLKGIEFRATIAGSIHVAEITGTISI